MTMRAPVTAPAHDLPAGMTAVGDRLPPSRRSGGLHEAVAAVLRDDPHVWYRVPGLPTMYAPQICAGNLRAFAPGGTFQATVRNHTLYVKYTPGVSDGSA